MKLVSQTVPELATKIKALQAALIVTQHENMQLRLALITIDDYMDMMTFSRPEDRQYQEVQQGVKKLIEETFKRVNE